MKKRKIVWILAATAMVGIMVSGCGKKEVKADEETADKEKTITVACSGTAVPYSYIEDDEHKGFEVDMWDEISKRTGYKVKMTTTGFSSIFGMLDSGQVDVAGNFFGMSEERVEKYDASVPYGAGVVGIAVNTDNDKIKTLEDLAGKKVAVSEGSQGQQVATEANKTVDFELVVYGAEGTTAMQELSLGRVDAWIESTLTIALDSQAADLKFTVLDDKLSKTNVAYFVKKGDEESAKKLEVINGAVEKMLEDGTIKELSQKWYYTDVTADIE